MFYIQLCIEESRFLQCINWQIQLAASTETEAGFGCVNFLCPVALIAKTTTAQFIQRSRLSAAAAARGSLGHFLAFVTAFVHLSNCFAWPESGISAGYSSSIYHGQSYDRLSAVV